MTPFLIIGFSLIHRIAIRYDVTRTMVSPEPRAGKHEEWTNRKTIFVVASVAFFAILVYGVLIKPIIKYGVRGTPLFSLTPQR